MSKFLKYLIQFTAMVVIAGVLAVVLPTVYGPLRVGIAVGVVFLITGILAARAQTAEILPEGSLAQFADQSFVWAGGYWRNGAQVLTDDELREIAGDEDIMYWAPDPLGEARPRD